MIEKKKIAVIFGGCSSEYEVSLQSAYSVITHLDTKKYKVILLGITRNGDWYRYYGAVDKIADNSWHFDTLHCMPAFISPSREVHGVMELLDGKVKMTSIDIVLPILHGKNGEDGSLQGLVELAGIPLAGCSTLSSALCMDKDRAHKMVALAGIKTPEAVVGFHGESIQSIIEKTKSLSYPMFVKPVKAGSSLGISKVYRKEELEEAVKKAFLQDNQVIIEESIEGFEVGCAVMGNKELTIGQVDEIELMEGFFDYTEKYTLKSSRIHMPARIDTKLALQVQEAAAAIYQALDCSGFARVDMFLTPKGEIVFNEVNTIPGFTSHSRFPNMMKGIGLSFADILDRLIHLGLEK